MDETIKGDQSVDIQEEKKPEKLKPEMKFYEDDEVNYVSDFDFSGYIPSKNKDYLERDEDKLFSACIKIGNPTILIGDSSSGKNEMVRQYCAKNGKPMLTISCHENVDFQEMLARQELKVKSGQTESRTEVGILGKFIENPNSLIHFEEPNRVNARALIFFHSAFEEGKEIFHENRKFKIRAKIALSINPVNDSYIGTEALDFALRTRLNYINIPQFGNEQIAQIANFGEAKDKEDFRRMYNFIEEYKRTNEDVTFIYTLRNAIHLREFLKLGVDFANAFRVSFLDGLYVNGEDEDIKAISEIMSIL